MKEEIVRVMDELGRVVIPAEYRSALAGHLPASYPCRGRTAS